MRTTPKLFPLFCLIVVVAATTLTCASCEQESSVTTQIASMRYVDSSQTASKSHLDSIYAVVAESLATLQAYGDGLRDRIEKLEAREASVSTETQTHSMARTKFGPFLFVCRGVTPYQDGYKVKLSVGNLTSATFRGARLNVEWGLPRPHPMHLEEYQDYVESMKSKGFGVTTVFLPGRYTNIEIALTPAKAEEIKTIRIGIQFDEISLRGR
jgi:hypothetical protein